jgi:2'-5' RNA ligase
MSHYLEVWLNGGLKQQFRAFRPWDRDYHPHITLVRPFLPQIEDDLIKHQIIQASARVRPMRAVAEGLGGFGRIRYVPVISPELNAYADVLEESIAGSVRFAPLLGEQRVLHVTLGREKGLDTTFPPTEFAISRLTALRNGRIWFGYDLESNKELSREEALVTKDSF